MDQVKIGKFIASQRKKNNLKQEDLAKKFNISCQAISKWERGIAFPDASILIELCDMLDITLEELLIGEKIGNQKVEKDKIIVEGINAYQKEAEGHTKKIFLTIIFIIFCIGIVAILGLSSYYKNNYNSVRIYNVTGIEDFKAEGKIIYTPVSKSFILYNLEIDLSKEINVNSLKICLENAEGIIFSEQHYSHDNKRNLKDFISDMTFYIEYDIDSQTGFTEDDFNNLNLVLYNGENGEKISTSNLTVTEEFSNKKINY